jgi:enediyne biosynthesis protein CalE5
MDQQKNAEGLAWQISFWDRMVPVYIGEIDKRFGPIVEHVIKRADLKPGQHVLDLGTGTGSVALKAAEAVAPNGRVTAVDISPDMLAVARRRAASAQDVTFVEGRAEAIPAEAESIDAVLASLSLMYVIDREAAAREIARVLRPGGRLVGAVWAGPERADIVLLQQTAGSFAPKPPVPGVGPGALGDPESFLTQLAEAGLQAHVETETVEFSFDDFASAWDALAGVTASQLEPERAEGAAPRETGSYSAARGKDCSLRTQSARHRVDHGTICGRSCAHSGPSKPLCACVDRTFVKSVAPACRDFFLGPLVRGPIPRRRHSASEGLPAFHSGRSIE